MSNQPHLSRQAGSAIEHQSSLAKRANQPLAISHQSSSLDSTADKDEVLVRVQGVSKRFCKDLKTSLYYGVRDVCRDLTGKSLAGLPLGKREFWANKDISFELRRGECLGLIGRNGAGKTTLLKMLNGLIKPDEGSIEIKGRVGALIALGAGFNPILTGRENVYVAASVYGLSKKEIDEKYDEIVEFAEMEEFMESPVQNYSSGMKVRLGFAVATAVEPDVLLIDEVLAVGDFAFRRKSMNRILERLPSMAVIFVSHNEGNVRTVCDRGIHLSCGTLAFDGAIDDAFLNYNLESSETKLGARNSSTEFIEPRISAASCELSYDQTASNIAIYIKLLSSLNNSKDLTILIYFKDDTEETIAQWISERHLNQYKLINGKNEFEINISDLPFKTGFYFLSIEIRDRSNSMVFFKKRMPDPFYTVLRSTTGKEKNVIQI